MPNLKSSAKKIAETRVALMKEGYDKERAEALLQYEEEKQRIFEEETQTQGTGEEAAQRRCGCSAERRRR